MKAKLSVLLSKAQYKSVNGMEVLSWELGRTNLRVVYGDDYEFPEEVLVKDAEVELDEHGHCGVSPLRGKRLVFFDFAMRRPITEEDLK
jgi:hypothetical protein